MEVSLCAERGGGLRLFTLPEHNGQSGGLCLEPSLRFGSLFSPSPLVLPQQDISEAPDGRVQAFSLKFALKNGSFKPKWLTFCSLSVNRKSGFISIYFYVQYIIYTPVSPGFIFLRIRGRHSESPFLGAFEEDARILKYW